MTSVLQCKQFTTVNGKSPSTITVIPTPGSGIQWIRAGIPSRNYLRIVVQDHSLYCLHCFPQGMQRMKIVIGSSAERVCNS